MSKTIHTIKMINKKDETLSITYNNVIDCTPLFGCAWELQFPDGNTATFEMTEWEMWDLTPHKGWNHNID